jgi:hypothetical protein
MFDGRPRTTIIGMQSVWNMLTPYLAFFPSSIMDTRFAMIDYDCAAFTADRRGFSI